MQAEPRSDDTRARLLAAAGPLFAEAGFESVTVRTICRQAHANVAAVNYHFGDKLGLYTALIMDNLRFPQEAAQASVSGTAEEQLHAFIGRYLSGLMGRGRPAWVARLTALEMSRPSPAFRHVIEDIIRPTEARLRAIVSQLIGRPPDHEQVRMCAHSVAGQCLHYRHAEHVLEQVWPDLWSRPDRLEILTDHITRFSLAGMRAIAHADSWRADGGQKGA